jgi:hypothetical protein
MSTGSHPTGSESAFGDKRKAGFAMTLTTCSIVFGLSAGEPTGSGKIVAISIGEQMQRKARKSRCDRFAKIALQA